MVVVPCPSTGIFCGYLSAFLCYLCNQALRLIVAIDLFVVGLCPIVLTATIMSFLREIFSLSHFESNTL